MDPYGETRPFFGLSPEEMNPDQEHAINVPGVWDIIHLTPKEKVTQEELEAHKMAIKRGLRSPLTPGQLDTLARKRQTHQRLKQSPTPEIVRSIGTVATWFDDTGDALNTAAWAGKGAIWLATKVGLKAATRAIPYVGYALLAKDVVDIANFWKYGLTMPIIKSKKEWKKDQTLNPFGKAAKLSRARRLAQKVPGVGDILEILQTTDALFGVGLCFGPIVGLFTDLLFGSAQDPIVLPGKKGYSPIDQTIRGIESGSYINSFGQEFTDVEHMYGLTPFAAAIQENPTLIKAKIEIAMGIDLWNREMLPRPVVDPVIRDLLREDGIDPDRREPWHLPGSPKTITLTELAQHTAKTAPGCLKHWLPPLARDKKSFVAGELINSIVFDGIPIFDGSPRNWTEHLSGLDRIIHDILDYATDYPLEGSPEDQLRWVEKEIQRRKEAKEWP